MIPSYFYSGPYVLLRTGPVNTPRVTIRDIRSRDSRDVWIVSSSIDGDGGYNAFSRGRMGSGCIPRVITTTLGEQGVALPALDKFTWMSQHRI